MTHRKLPQGSRPRLTDLIEIERIPNDANSQTYAPTEPPDTSLVANLDTLLESLERLDEVREADRTSVTGIRKVLQKLRSLEKRLDDCRKEASLLRSLVTKMH